MEYLKTAMRDTRSMAVTVGLATVVVTHTALVIGMLPGSLDKAQKENHAYINLAAAGAILYGSRILG